MALTTTRSWVEFQSKMQCKSLGLKHLQNKYKINFHAKGLKKKTNLENAENYSCQHLKWIKKVQSCPKTRMHFGFRTTLMKGFDPLQMLTSVLRKWI